MNKQREIIYNQRRQILEGVSLKEEILEAVEEILDNLIEIYLGKEMVDYSGKESLIESINLKFGVKIDIEQIKDLTLGNLKDKLYQTLIAFYEEKEKQIGSAILRQLEREVFLQIIDSKWKDHLYAMDELREGIGLRAYGQRDPLVEYRNEAFLNFEEMVKRIREESIEILFKIQPLKPAIFKGVFSSLNQELMHPELDQFQVSASFANEPLEEKSVFSKRENSTFEKRFPKVGRNDPCPCGKIDPHTGKPIKFKKCHGRNL